MNTRDLIRIIVLKTNSLWPLRYLNRIPYYLAIKIFIWIFSPFKEIKSIYLRHGLSEKNWVPGISDIDLTLIIDGDISREKSYTFLKSFWKKFEQLKKFFPMLGEVDIINNVEAESWTKFSIRGYESRNWKLLYGLETVKNNYTITQDILAVDSLNYAITTYLEYFVSKFYSDEGSAFIKNKELQRLTSKIFRYAKVPFARPDFNIKKDNSNLRSGLLFNILRRLESSLKNITLRESSDERDFSLSQNPESEKFNSEEINFEGLANYKDKIASFIISYTIRFIILKNDLKDDEIVECIEAIRKTFSGQKIKPVILSQSLFEYLIRVYNPFVYSQLYDAREILLGNDLLLNIKPPDYFYYKKALLKETGNIILFPKKYSLISQENIQQFLLNGFSSDVNRILFLKLFLEKEILETEFNGSLEKCKKNYPSYLEQTEYLIRNYNLTDKKKLSFDTYVLLSNLTSDVHNALSTSRNNDLSNIKF